MPGPFLLSDLPTPLIRYGVGLWRRRWLAMAITWAAALVCWFLVWLIPDQYESRAQVFVQTESVLDPVMNGVTARPDYERRVEVMSRQLLTRPNVEAVIERSGLDSLLKGANPRQRKAELEGLVKWVAGEISIESPQPMYFDIRYQFGDPQIARNVVDAVLNLLIEQDLGASLSENEDARNRLETEIETFGEKMTAREAEIADFRRLHAEELAAYEGNDRKRDLIESDLSRVSDELSLAQRRVVSARSILASTPSTSSGTELDRLMVQLETLRSQYNESYPDIQAVKARIEQLQRGGEGVLPNNPEFVRLRAELRAAEDSAAALADRQQRLRGELESLAFRVGQAPAVVADLQRIERDYKQMQETYADLVQRRDRLSLTANLGAGGRGVQYKIFERPEVSLIPSSPPRMILILASLVAAVGAGVAVALLLSWLRKSFTQSQELEAAFGLPVLGALSEASSEAVQVARVEDFKRLGLATAALAILTLGYIYWEVFRLPTVKIDGPQSATASYLRDRGVSS